MTRTTALVWKEYRETHWFLWAGLSLFIAPMLLELGINYSRGHLSTDSGEGMVLGLGGLLAVLLAVAVTARDLHDSLETFWRSRPIGTWRLVAIKYIVGLTVLLAIVLITMGVQIAFQAADLMRRIGQFRITGSFAAWVTFAHTFTLIIIYSVAFLIGCLVRQAAQATILSVAAGLIIYFVPMLIPALAPVGVFSLMEDIVRNYGTDWGRYTVFIAAMLGGSAAAFVLAVQAVKRQWRLRTDQRLIYWTLGGVVILLLGTSALVLRSNMVLLENTSVESAVGEAGWKVARLRVEGGKGVALLKRYPNDWDHLSLCDYAICRVELDNGKPKLGKLLQLPGGQVPTWWPDFEPQLVWSADQPDQVQVLRVLGKQRQMERRGGTWWSIRSSVSLLTIALDASGPEVKHQLDLPSLAGIGELRLAASGQRLFLLKNRFWTLNSSGDDSVRRPGPPWLLLSIDAGGVDGPVIANSQELERAGLSFPPVARGKTVGRLITTETIVHEPWLELLPLEGLAADEQLRVSFELSRQNNSMALVNSTLFDAGREGLTAYKPQHSGQRAMFVRVGEYHTVPLLAYLNHYAQSVAADAQAGVLYVSYQSLGGTVMAYDIRNPQQPRRIGHYAVPQGSFPAVSPLESGRALLGGSSLSVVRLPQR